MIYTNLIYELFLRLEEEGNILLSSLISLETLISDKNKINELEKQIQTVDKLRISFNSTQTEIIHMLNSTHYNKLSSLVSDSNNKKLEEKYNKIRLLLYDIAMQTRSTNELLTLCQRLNSNKINLLFGKKQQPTNYNFDKNNINTHLFNTIKIHKGER